MPLESVNIVAVFAAAALYFVFGAVWYGVLAKPWMRYSRVTEEQVKQGAGSVTYVIAAVTSLLCSAALAYLIAVSPADSLAEYLLVAAVCSAGLVIAALGKHYAFQSHPPGLLAIDGGYDLVGFLLMAAVFWSWR